MGLCGSTDKASKQAQANEDAKQAQLAAATSRINSIFDNPQRTSEYGNLAADTAQYYQSQLDRQKAVNDRKLRFALARSGQTGGSVQADQGRTLGEDYLRGVTQADRMGQQAGAKLRAADAQSRANLIAMAQGGMDATTAAQNSASMLRSNLENASANAQSGQFVDAFANLADLYKKSQDAKANRQMQQQAFNSIYHPGFGQGATPYGG